MVNATLRRILWLIVKVLDFEIAYVSKLTLFIYRVLYKLLKRASFWPNDYMFMPGSQIKIFFQKQKRCSANKSISLWKKERYQLKHQISSH